jgi:hypothetical protein
VTGLLMQNPVSANPIGPATTLLSEKESQPQIVGIDEIGARTRDLHSGVSASARNAEEYAFFRLVFMEECYGPGNLRRYYNKAGCFP